MIRRIVWSLLVLTACRDQRDHPNEGLIITALSHQDGGVSSDSLNTADSGSPSDSGGGSPADAAFAPDAATVDLFPGRPEPIGTDLSDADPAGDSTIRDYVRRSYAVAVVHATTVEPLTYDAPPYRGVRVSLAVEESVYGAPELLFDQPLWAGEQPRIQLGESYLAFFARGSSGTTLLYFAPIAQGRVSLGIQRATLSAAKATVLNFRGSL